jgi:NAD(P)-dependent dehydrogenase (short-subunit alcohol dehydrogenase family)
LDSGSPTERTSDRCADLLRAAGAEHRNGDGIKSVALCPGFVDTPMTEFIREQVKQQDMIKTADIAASVRFLLALSPACVAPEIVFQRPGEAI